MKNGPLSKKERETLISVSVSLLVMTGILVLLIFTGRLFTTSMDDRIAAAAKDQLALKSYLKEDNIQVYSQDGAVTLTGTVAAEPHLLAAIEAISDLPGVKRVDNRLEVRPHAHAVSDLELADPDISGSGLSNLLK